MHTSKDIKHSFSPTRSKASSCHQPNCAAMADEVPEIVRLFQDAPPAHYTLKIEGFSAFCELLKEKLTIYDSEEFEAGGYKWKLVLCPSGETEKYISLRVAIADPPNGYATAMLRLFVYNHAKEKYLAVQDWRARRYHDLKMDHGFDQLLSLDEFLEPKSGYLVDDCCAFGAEVHVMESARSNVNKSIMAKNLNRDADGGVHRWIIDNFSTLEDTCESTTFTGGPSNWKIQLYPKGNKTGKGNSVSAYLVRSDDNKGQKMLVKFKLVVEHQCGGDHRTFAGCCLFDGNDANWGTHKLISLADLTPGYLKEDRLIVEASIEAYFI